MPENPCTHRQNTPKVLYETVAFRYSDEGNATLVGEAEIMIETFGDAADSNVNLYAVRVDILSAFATTGCDEYERVMADPALRHAIERSRWCIISTRRRSRWGCRGWGRSGEGTCFENIFRFGIFEEISAILESIPKASRKKSSLKIPESLVYETMDGKPVYRKGYKSVLTGDRNPEKGRYHR